MKLYHYSREPIGEVYSCDPTRGVGRLKPGGLWVSIGEEWKEYCQAEDFQTGGLCIVSEVQLTPNANILCLHNAADLFRFTDEYAVNYGIDWASVAEKYQGIIIAPYIYECRLDERTSWYYGWDCASGCIWDHRAIQAVDIVTTEPR